MYWCAKNTSYYILIVPSEETTGKIEKKTCQPNQLNLIITFQHFLVAWFLASCLGATLFCHPWNMQLRNMQLHTKELVAQCPCLPWRAPAVGGGDINRLIDLQTQRILVIQVNCKMLTSSHFWPWSWQKVAPPPCILDPPCLTKRPGIRSYDEVHRCTITETSFDGIVHAQCHPANKSPLLREITMYQ